MYFGLKKSDMKKEEKDKKYCRNRENKKAQSRKPRSKLLQIIAGNKNLFEYFFTDFFFHKS
jgi:hypothetical protein